MSDNQKTLDFWTLREALLKACGVGLTLPPASFALVLAPDRLVRGDPVLLPRAAWLFERRQPTASLLLALAVDLPRKASPDVHQASW